MEAPLKTISELQEEISKLTFEETNVLLRNLRNSLAFTKDQTEQVDEIMRKRGLSDSYIYGEI